jgi:hypothetical protein
VIARTAARQEARPTDSYKNVLKGKRGAMGLVSFNSVLHHSLSLDVDDQNNVAFG